MTKKIAFRMKMVPFALAGIIALGSCSKDTELFDENHSKKQYEQTWKATFGDIDPTQDWNGATRGSVTVNLNGTSTVSVYASVDSTYRLVGKYENISGSQELKFDMPKGTEDILVNTQNKSIETKVGKTVDFTSLGLTRAMSTYNNNGIVVGEANEDWTFNTDLLSDVRNVLPENKDNRDNDGVTKDFYFTSDGTPFVVYPFYWETGNTLELGIYYLDDSNNIVRVPIYTTNDNDNNNARLFYNENGKWQHAYNSKENYPKTQYAGAFPKGYEGSLMSRGIKVTLPKGLKYGMYIYNTSDNVYLYSESTHNNDPYYIKGKYLSESISGKYACYGAIYKTNDDTFLSFEDWKRGSSAGGYDLNDLIVRITPAPTYHDVEKEEQSITWTVACEDLGDTGDIDFNDIVFSVSHVSGSSTAYVTPLAAGGVLKAEIFYNGDRMGEIHELLGSSGTDGKYPIINTSTKTATANVIKVGVDENFTMTNNMGNFTIKVSDVNSAVTISAPPVGGCPQMFVVPGNWNWPREYVHIEKAYPSFTDWSKSEQKNIDWYKTYDEGLVIK